MKLIFARHGESEANVLKVISNRDLPHALTKKGRLQAQDLAEQLVKRQVRALYASPILRAQQTARIVAEKLNLPIQTTEALREFDCGVVEGRGDEIAWQAHNAIVAAWDNGDYERSIEEGESFYDVQVRFEPFVRRLIEEFGQQAGDIVLISHGSMLHQMLPLVLVNVDRTFTHQNPLGNCVCVVAVLRQNQLICEQWGDIRL